VAFVSLVLLHMLNGLACLVPRRSGNPTQVRFLGVCAGVPQRGARLGLLRLFQSDPLRLGGGVCVLLVELGLGQLGGWPKSCTWRLCAGSSATGSRWKPGFSELHRLALMAVRQLRGGRPHDPLHRATLLWTGLVECARPLCGPPRRRPMRFGGSPGCGGGGADGGALCASPAWAGGLLLASWHSSYGDLVVMSRMIAKLAPFSCRRSVGAGRHSDRNLGFRRDGPAPTSPCRSPPRCCSSTPVNS